MFFQDPSVQKVGGGRKKTVSFSSMPSEKKVEESGGNLINKCGMAVLMSCSVSGKQCSGLLGVYAGWM